MRPNEAELLRVVFDFLDTVIDDYGLYLFMGFAYAAIPFLVWVLCGGLRRSLLKGKPMPHMPSAIVIHLPGRPPAPTETFNPFPPYHERPDCDCDDARLD
jgi:hypothetical protein